VARISQISQDPEMAVLDQETGDAIDTGTVAQTTESTEPVDLFKLKPEDLSDLKPALLESDHLRRPKSRSRGKRFRHRRDTRREKIGAVAITMGVAFVVLMFVLVGSCNGGS
jgi:hypothetical protein